MSNSEEIELCEDCGSPMEYDGKNYHSKSCTDVVCDLMNTYVFVKEFMEQLEEFEESEEDHD